MREMTTAEFAKYNLAGLQEPVSIRRYTKKIGVYYPDGTSPLSMIQMGPTPSPEQVEALRMQLEIPTPDRVNDDRIRELEEENAILKLELARRPALTTAPGSAAMVDAVSKTFLEAVPRKK
jgi:hypothetical protein